VNAGVLDRIADLMHLGLEDTVVEIGPGSGFLTERLLERAGAVIAVELDRKMCDYLRKKFANRPNFQLIEQDVLRFDFESIEAPRFKVVGNLPYAITSKIMFKLAGELDMEEYPLRQRMEQLTVMVQKEVGERITAKPGQRAYNPLSIALQFWFDPRLDFGVPARDFYPPPKVESAVVSLFPRTGPRAKVRDMAVFGRLVRTAFAQKRKTIRNALLNGAFANAGVLDKIFGATGIDSSLRAEALPVEAFGDLANALCSDTSQS
jgi:16S rRNA (adenine1518-N6/adenine1519-N6)-dimethyltransferase